MDLLLINPGGRELVYQDLASGLTAVEPPPWCRLIAAYVADRGHSVQIIDSEAQNLSSEKVAEAVAALNARLVAVIVYGHHPSASTQQMAGGGALCRAIKQVVPEQPIVIAGGHVAALPERTMREEAVDFACSGEGPITIDQLLQALASGSAADFSRVQGLVWRENGHIRIEVSDEGPGIPAGEEERIFERFYRADSARTRSDGGSGLGLAIARWIVDMHGGEIKVVPGSSRMVVALPS